MYFFHGATVLNGPGSHHCGDFKITLFQTHQTEQDVPGRVISPQQRILPDITLYSQETNIFSAVFELPSQKTSDWRPKPCSVRPVGQAFRYTGRFIIFPLITNIYNKKTKGHALMGLFTATGKLKKFFLDNYRYSMCAPRVIRHTPMQFSSSCHTRVKTGESIFFNSTMIRGFGSSRTCRLVLCVLCTKCTLHSDHRLTHVIFQHTKHLLTRSENFLIT